jgi:N utilization substance protein A
LCFELGRATVVVNEDQLSLAIGKRGQNVRLAARLTKWDVDILTPAEFTKSLDILEACLKTVEGLDEEHIDKLAALGVISVFDVEEVGAAYLEETLGLDEELAEKIVIAATERGKTVAEEQAREKEEAERERQQREAELASMPGEAQAASVLGDLLPDTGGSIVDMLEQRQEAAAQGNAEEASTDNEDSADADSADGSGEEADKQTSHETA